ncbi:MAG: lysine--tRNA ligase [Blastocatellia bacterium]|nr:lysine--tRNA ligase [Blastocatellia bacterium]
MKTKGGINRMRRGIFGEENELIVQRRKNFEVICALGFDPYPHKFERTHTITEIVRTYGHYAGAKPPEELERVNAELRQIAVRIAGRMMTTRLMGRAAFAHLSDGDQRLQIYIRSNEVSEREWQLYNHLDLGDIIGAEGYLFVTRTGELTVHVQRLHFLAKAFLPLPEKWHGLQDIETRYRQRYLDLIANRASREVFVRRAQIIKEIRRFFDERGYIEVETPMLTPLATGAAARPFITHHNALDMDLYARIAPELYLKRLIVGGFEKVYELNRNFRNEGLSTKHNPEFTMLEFYEAYSDYEDLMELTEELLTHLARTVCGSLIIEYAGHRIDLTRPWRRLTIKDAILQYWPETVPAPTPQDLDAPERLPELLHAVGGRCDPRWNHAQMLGKLFEYIAEEKLIQPTFIVGYPTELSPLAKQSEEDPAIVHRFELYIGGLEIANAFCELNDPAEQYRRFEQQMRLRERGDEEAMVMDEDFIRALGYGMPPTAGEGIGIDRLVMLLTNQRSIRDVILFPHMRPER